MSYTRIRPRRGTLYEWTTVNPILAEGEIGVEYPDSGVGTGLSKFKIGNGTAKYSELAYAFDGASANSIDGGDSENSHTIKIRSDTAEKWTTVNPILKANEIAYDTTNKAFKMGDGTTKWSALSFVNAGGLTDNNMDFGDEG